MRANGTFYADLAAAAGERPVRFADRVTAGSESFLIVRLDGRSGERGEKPRRDVEKTIGNALKKIPVGGPREGTPCGGSRGSAGARARI
jgi:hypothetical protein